MPTTAAHHQHEILNVVGDRIRILADSEATGGKFLVFETITQPGSGPPLHRHTHDDEFFYIAEGSVKFEVDGVTRIVDAGGTAFAPKGSVHAFACAGQAPSRMIITCCPGGLERPFRECDALAREGRATPETIEAAFRKFDLEIVGPPLTV
mgnify:CR=1 FL=1